MRINNSMKNIYTSILAQIIVIFLGFISRKVFLDSLGTEYLGINGLLTNILSMLSLVEGGIGVSITYNLYKPLSEKNEEKIIALIQLYKKLYGILAIFIFLLSLTLYPFLGIIIKDTQEVPFVGLIYFIFVIKNMISYLNAHKWALINADQKGYVLVKYDLLFNIINTIAKIIILLITKNYILYLLIEAGIFVIQNLWNGRIVNKRYSYIKTRKRYFVEKDVKENLITNVKALFLHNIGTYCVFGTDNLLISAFISVKMVGLYSNYTMIIGQLASLLKPMIEGIGASVGHLVATESKEKNYEVFKVVRLVNFWVYSFCGIFLFNLIEPFINWWLGDGLLLDRLTLIVILINFYITGMRSSINIFKSKAGIFSEDKYVPLIEAAINLGASLILVKYFGLAGIFMGTTISTITIPLWTQSKLVYNKVFNKSVTEYFKVYIFYIVLTIFTGILTAFTCNNLILWTSFSALVAKGVICIIIPNFIYFMVFFKTNEFIYLFNIFKPMVDKLLVNLKLNI
ncbi:oligosaccharide flippase family protein [Clostridium perfringens]|uniref:lipopolysaccharide biosynthesis protein n=1 Tax=Clostridium perfringens TaxID=1502 RepID=UPI002AC59DEA|nr:hypothetical protein [Clostridium perfringens]MDZ4983576.1 oligosaccharide flippase family protein [Clostridium perfringens]